MTDINSVLHHCSIFDGLPEEKYPNILHCLQGREAHFSREETILNIGEHSQMAGIVLSGTIELAFFDENGNQNSVNHINEGAVFGAERACSDDSHENMIRLRAITDCEVLFLNFANLLKNNNGCPYCARVTANLLRDFARQTQFLNLKLQIMGQKHLRDKLKIYLQTLHMEPDGLIRLPFNRRELAEFLYADRSALSRELGRMQEDGILTYEGRELRMLDKSFLAQ